jgi:mevalonate kinase
MPAISASYPGKIILFGEHAVVYNSHAIAIPVSQVKSRAVIQPLLSAPAGTIEINAVDTHTRANLNDLPQNHPLATAIRLTLKQLTIQTPPAFIVRASSEIPMSAGLGSGASISCSIIRAVSNYLGKPLPAADISALAFEVEKIHHGNPSGVDNTVIAFNQPILFKRGEAMQPVVVGSELHFLIADTGLKASTAEVVAGVRSRWQAEPERYNTFFHQVDAITLSALAAIRAGQIAEIGRLMSENHRVLQSMAVSHPALDRLAEAARSAGAYGAKLSGAGAGGNLIALVAGEQQDQLERSFLQAGATRVIRTTLIRTGQVEAR